MTMYNNGNGNLSQYRKSYDFVTHGKTEFYDPKGKPVYSGYIDLTIVCLSNLHIGNGYKSFFGNGKELVNETIKLNGKPIIPGSSFKGAVRAIAEAVSNSCYPQQKRCSAKECCIVCDMFGCMGKGSKVIFPDFRSISDVKTEVMELNSQFSPSSKKGNSPEYKFYKTGPNDYDIESKVKAEVVKYDSEFSGRIFFKRLTEEQLSLLMFAMGLNDEKLINLKIGGFKNEGMGEVYMEVPDYRIEGIKKEPCELAAQYAAMETANKEAIDKINDIFYGEKAE